MAGSSLGGTFRLILVKHVEITMYKNKMSVMDADCLKTAVFLSFRGESKQKNEKMNQLQAVVANARPERTLTRRSSAGDAERTRILVPAEQGNRVRIPDTERSQPIGFAGSDSGQRAIRAGPGGRLPKVAVFLKHCFPYGVIRAR